MKKMIFILVLIIIIVTMCITVYAGYDDVEFWPDESEHPEITQCPYVLVSYTPSGPFLGSYSFFYFYSKPVVEYYMQENGKWWFTATPKDENEPLIRLFWSRPAQKWVRYDIGYGFGTDDFEEVFIYSNFTSAAYDARSLRQFNIVDYILGTGTTPENPTIFDYFAGINFDYEGFLGKVGVKLEAKREGQESYVPIQEWEYPEGDGTVNIDSHDIVYYNNASYKLTIYDDDEVINNYYYIVNATNEKQPYIDIIYPSNGFQYEYFPNINIEYFDMGDLRIYINEVLYKRISTSGKEGIEVIPGTHSLFQMGLNTIYVEDVDSQTVATVQYMVMREGEDPTIINEPEFDSDSWVRELYQRIMSEYSQFFIYIKNIYSFLPYEILGLVVIVIMLSVVLWFTGRK